VLATIILGIAQLATTARQEPADPTTGAPTTTGTGIATAITTVDTGEHFTLFPIVSGRANPGATVTVRIGTVELSVTADAQGSWSTADSPVDGLPEQGIITAIADGETQAVTTAFSVAPPPVISVLATGTMATYTVVGLPNTTIEILLDGNVVASGQIGGTEQYEGPLELTPGTHFIQARYADQDRIGPSSPTTSITVA
jgi:hypothetical protein